MKISCDVIRDLLPSYIEDLTSEDSNKIIEEHIDECTNCKEVLEILKQDLLVKEQKNVKLDKSSTKLFKKIRRKTFKYIGISLLIGIIIGILGPQLNSITSASNSASEFLKNLKEENYEKAFEYVYYFDEASDINPKISYEYAKELWIERVKNLKENGTYLKDYKILKVEIDDTYAHGSVELTVVENGVQNTYEAYMWFGPTDDVTIGPIWFRNWKVGNFQRYDNNDKSKFEEGIGGFIKEY